MADIFFKETISLPGIYLHKEGYRQKPYVSPKELAYKRLDYVRTQDETWGGAVAPVAGSAQVSVGMQELYVAVTADSLTANNLSALAYSRAYNKLLSKTGERASLLTALAERKSTYSMVLNRLAQLYKGAKALRRGRFREFLSTFGIKAKPKHKNHRWSRPRDFSSLWLEYWFGWAPTIGDIDNAMKVWQSPLSSKMGLREGSGDRHYMKDGKGSTSAYTITTSCSGFFVLQLRCQVSITNPDLFVANSLGLLNPVRTVWETTPFSWFADWFTNVGQILGYFTDTLGVKISDVWSTRFAKGTEQRTRISKPLPTSGYRFAQDFVFMRRMKHKALPRPALVFRIPGISWTRGLTLSSLLVQLFSPNKPSRA